MVDALARVATPARPKEKVVSAADVNRLAEVLLAETGLAFPSNRMDGLLRAARQLVAERGLKDGATLSRLVTARDPEILRRLIALVTVGETYFFRHAEQLEVVRGVLQDLVAERRRSGERRLRIWSAGCATGEEAYSLAILAREAVGTLDGWDIRIVGTDINVEALERARAGVYGRWSFRGRSDAWAHWFTREHGGQRVSQTIKDLVAFELHNIASARTPPAALDDLADLVVCRNVTIYLDPQRLAPIAANFHAAIRPGGFLVVGPVESSNRIYGAFEPMLVDNVTLYRRAQRLRSGAPPEPTTPPNGGKPGHASRTVRTGRGSHRPPRPARPARASLPTPGPARSAAPLSAARALADAGRLGEARAACEASLARDPRLAGGYALLATIAEEEGDLAAARAALGRAIYLDRSDGAAQFRLGLLEWRTGRIKAARPRLAAALSLVEGRPDDEYVDEGRELQVGRLRGVVKLMLG